MKTVLFTLGSLALTATVIGNAYYQKKEFYPTAIYITKSKFSIAALYVQGFVCVFLVAKLMVKIFFGQLRSTEFEHLREKFWYAITETCLAFTMFKDDLTPHFIALFTILLFLRSFHWLAEERVDFFFQLQHLSDRKEPNNYIALSSSDHICDACFVYRAYHSVMIKPSVQLVFGFEYAILFVIGLNITIKYILHAVDLQNDTPWDDKAVCLLYSDLVMGLCKVILFLAFIGIMIQFYSFFPLFIVRSMYLSLRAFRKAVLDVIRSRQAVHNMNTLYPDASAEELQSSDNVCIICREEMTTGAKKLPCNHIFHSACLRSWFQRQQTCPTCRMNILIVRPSASQIQQQQSAPQLAQPVNGQPPTNFFNIPPHLWPSMQQVLSNARQETSNSSNNTATGPSMPFLLPPFPLLPFMVPPPTIPNDFSGLTVEELQLMERNEREAIELRIKTLKNIQTLLDAAMLQINQYLALVESTSKTTGEQLAEKEKENEIGEASSKGEISGVKEAVSEERDEVRKKRLEKFQPNKFQ